MQKILEIFILLSYGPYRSWFGLLLYNKKKLLVTKLQCIASGVAHVLLLSKSLWRKIKGQALEWFATLRWRLLWSSSLLYVVPVQRSASLSEALIAVADDEKQSLNFNVSVFFLKWFVPYRQHTQRSCLEASQLGKGLVQVFTDCLVFLLLCQKLICKTR